MYHLLRPPAAKVNFTVSQWRFLKYAGQFIKESGGGSDAAVEVFKGETFVGRMGTVIRVTPSHKKDAAAVEDIFE